MTSESSVSSSPPSGSAKAVPKRSHRKSRLGCTSCKVRKVKCDEVRPVCRACRLRKTVCEYGATSLQRSERRDQPMDSTANDAFAHPSMAQTGIVSQPVACLPSSDAIDMKLLWFYTSATHKTLSYNDDKQGAMNEMLQTVVVQHAFSAPFLMDSILELATQHMQTLGKAPEPTRALVYQVRSSEGYRNAIRNPRPETYGALLANSVFRPILSTQFFRDPTYKGLYLLDWIVLWRGVESIITITNASSVEDSGMGPLFSRPEMYSDASMAAIPKQLLLMISFIEHEEDDAEEISTYQKSLRALGSLFRALQDGLDSVMVVRIVTWGTFAPARLLILAKAGRPRALIMLAYYAAFLKLVQDVWWLAGVGDRSLRDICHAIGPEWHKYLSIPLSAMLVEERSDLFGLLTSGLDE